jgi:hypothetical protein
LRGAKPEIESKRVSKRDEVPLKNQLPPIIIGGGIKGMGLNSLDMSLRVGNGNCGYQY